MSVRIDDPPITSAEAECADYMKPCDTKDVPGGTAVIMDHRAKPSPDVGIVMVELYRPDRTQVVSVHVTDVVEQRSSMFWKGGERLKSSLPDTDFIVDLASRLASIK
ncbi:hypothetical protein [Amycolatopsis samaneae]|uniref:Uncharacterized protein n=1 Tax=Amycolatopsis samaneae TaxID=664691 RepID=A0ABW5GX24_9PSEU